MGEVLVPRERWVRWVANFETRHGASALSVEDGAMRGVAADGSTFTARLPFDARYEGPAAPGPVAAAAAAPGDWGILLVRKGGFAVARLAGERLVAHKLGRRHVQGRTKAGGQSQQRFARRRDNQARAAYDAAADHAVRLLGSAPAPELPTVQGGDRAAVAAVAQDPRLGHLRTTGPWLAVPDPRRRELDRAVLRACSLMVEVFNAGGAAAPSAELPNES